MVVGAYNPSYSGGWGSRIAWIRQSEAAVSRDRTTALQPSNRVGLHLKKRINGTEYKNISFRGDSTDFWQRQKNDSIKRGTSFQQIKLKLDKYKHTNLNHYLKSYIEINLRPGTVTQACNPSNFGRPKWGRSPEVSSSRLAWQTWRNPVSTKHRKISQEP